MSDISATDAARRFSDLLDAVEHGGEHFTVLRHGRAIARIEPVRAGKGAALKLALERRRADGDWAGELDELRALVRADQRT